MSPFQPFDPVIPGPRSDASVGPAAAQRSELIEDTKHQIRSIVREISQMSASELPLEDYCEGFMSRVASALAAPAAAIWLLGKNGRLRLQYQVNFNSTGLRDDEEARQRHASLLRRIAANENPVLVPPSSGTSADNGAGNSSDLLMVVGLIRIDEDTVGLVEVFQRAEGGPATQRGYLRFLVQMCEIAEGFFKNRRLKDYDDRHQFLVGLEGFVGSIHRDLEMNRTAYTIANEARRLIDCDRLSVIGGVPGDWRLLATGGLESVDRRSTGIQQLERLAERVLRTGDALWYQGSMEELPPQLTSTLSDYLDCADAHQLAVVPLYPVDDRDEDAPATQQTPVGALIVEQFDGEFREELPQQVTAIAGHCGSALANAATYDAVPWASLWRSLAGPQLMRRLSLTGVVAATLTLAIAALALIPADLALPAEGTLEPSIRREIYSGIDGSITDVMVDHGNSVEKGQTLATIRNTDFDVALSDVIGRRTRTRERIISTQRQLLGESKLGTDRQDQLSGELLELRETEVSLQREYELLQQKQELLTIKSPLAGQVVTWHLRDQLNKSIVSRGQKLMTIVDPNGPWQLELELKEAHMGTVSESRDQTKEKLTVSFALATHPGQEYQGNITQIQRVAQPGRDGSPVVRVLVDIDEQHVAELHPGTTVIAQVHCGRRSLGVVVFHDLINFVRTKTAFWF